jgi:DNA-binding MarR family transcriptional regulator
MLRYCNILQIFIYLIGFNLDIKELDHFNTMVKQDPSNDPTKNLPISLQGIETILIHLYNRDKRTTSMRKIAEKTDMSVRVVKNVLLQLEKFNQVERVTEGDNIIPKWRITNFGKKVVDQVKGLEKQIRFTSKEEELLSNITIPSKFEALEVKLKSSQDLLFQNLNRLQSELSKVLGPILNLNHPKFEDLVSFIIKRVKFLRQIVNNLPQDLIAKYKLKKIGEKKEKLSKDDFKLLYIEAYFFNSIALNQAKRMIEIVERLSVFLETSSISNSYSIGHDLREEVRVLTNIIEQRKLLDVHSHRLDHEELQSLLKNEIQPGILNDIINISLSRDTIEKSLEEIVLALINRLERGENEFEDHNFKLTENIPLYAFFQLILDENPNLNFNILQLERIIESLSNKGYLPGIRVIELDENRFLKVVQLKAHDVSEDEKLLISTATQFQKFSLSDIIKSTGWSSQKVNQLLERLTKLGILKYSKSFLHGDQWYIVSEN